MNDMNAEANPDGATVSGMETAGGPELVSSKMEPTTAAAQEAVAYWRVTFRMYRDDPELCVLFVGGQEQPTLDTIGVTPTPLELVSVEPRFVKQHRWDQYGERCLDCGDKDWMNDPVCRPRMADPSIEATPSIAVDPSAEVTPMRDVAPVAAAPVCADCLTPLLYECVGCSATNYPASTPAAPGVDLRSAILQLRDDALHMKDPGDTVNAYDRVLRLFDASPKGGSDAREVVPFPAIVREVLAWYASDPSEWIGWNNDDWAKEDRIKASGHFKFIGEDSRGHSQYVPNEVRAEEALAELDGWLEASKATSAEVGA